MSGILETLNHVEVIYYKKRIGNLGILSQASIVEDFDRLSSDVRRFYRAAALAEIVLRLGTEEEGNEAIFRLLLSSLNAFSRRPVETLGDRFISYFWGMINLLGYAPQVDSCIRCGRSNDSNGPVFLSVPDGGTLCVRCGGGSESDTYRLSSNMRRALNFRNLGQVIGLRRDEEMISLALAEEYMNYHLQDRRSLACWDMLRTLWNDVDGSDEGGEGKSVDHGESASRSPVDVSGPSSPVDGDTR